MLDVGCRLCGATFPVEEARTHDCRVTRAEFELLCRMVECIACQPLMPFSDTSGPRTWQTEALMREWAEYRSDPSTLGSSPKEDDRG